MFGLMETLLATAQGSHLTAEFDVSDLICDGENLLAVKVYKFCDGSYLENQDMWFLSGYRAGCRLISRTKDSFKRLSGRKRIPLAEWGRNFYPFG